MAHQAKLPEAAARHYEKYSTRMQFEHGLINNRITWLLVSQGLLFSAYSASFQNCAKTESFRTTVEYVGVTVSILAVVGILASMAAKYYTWKDLRENARYDTEPFWVRTPITCLAGIAEIAIPVVFIVAWWRI